MLTNVFVHFNPGSQGDASWWKTIDRKFYQRNNRFGTLCIKELSNNFEVIARTYLEHSHELYGLEYGYTRLAYEDRTSYNKQIGRETAIKNSKYQAIQIKGIHVSLGKTCIYLQVPDTVLQFQIEY